MIKIEGIPELIVPGGQTKERRWIKVFSEFIGNLRIKSKEVQSVDERGVPLDLWGSQKMYIANLAEGMERGVRTFYCLKSRQLGISTVSLAIDLFWLGLHKGLLGCLVVDNEGNRDSFRQTLETYHSSLPKNFIGNRFEIVKNNATYMSFSNGSRLDFLVAGTRKKNWGEGRGYALAHLTEIASYGTQEGISSFKESFSETNPDRLFVAESTAKGRNHWYVMFLEGERDTLSKKSFFIGWWSKELNSIPKTDMRFNVYGRLAPNQEEKEKMELVHKLYGVKVSMEQLAWKRWRDSDSSTTQADQDQNQPWLASESFVHPGYTFFPYRYIEKILNVIYDPEGGVDFAGYRFILGDKFAASRMEAIGPDGDISDVQLRIWEEPNDDATYVVGCDPAFGRNEWKDRHSVQVYRCYADKMVQVAEYADNNVYTYQAAWVLAYLCGCYKNCIVNIELTGGPGHAVFKELNDMRDDLRADMNQKMIRDRHWEDFLANAQYYMWHRPDSMGAGYAYHTDMSGKIKFMVWNKFRDSLMTGALVIRSAPMLEEMIRVVQEGAQIEAKQPDKDDRVAASILAHMAWQDWVRPGMIQRGATYEEVTLTEQGRSTPIGNTVKVLVQNFWKTRAQVAEEEENPISSVARFMEERGFYE